MTSPVAGRSIRSSLFAATAANLLRGVTGFVAGLLVARGLGPAGRGEFTFITNSTMLLVLLGAGGASSALIHLKATEDRSPRELYAASAVVGVGTGLAAAGLLCATYLLVPSLFRGIDGGEIVWVLGLVVPLVTMSIWTAVGYLEDRVREFSMAAVGGSFAFLVAIVALNALTALTPASVVSAWATTSLLPVILVAHGRLARPTRAAFDLAGRLIRFGVRANLATLALVLTWRVDVIFVKAHRGLAELGFYAVAVGLGEIFVQLAVSLRIALTPRQGSSVDRVRLVDTICLSTRAMLAAGAVVTVLCTLMGRPVVTLLYGARFEPTADALLWLMPGVVALAVQGPLIDYLLVQGRIRGVTVTTLAALAVNVAMNAILLPDHSFVFAAVSSTVAYLGSCAGCMALFCHATSRSIRELAVPTVADLQYLHGLVRRDPARQAG